MDQILKVYDDYRVLKKDLQDFKKEGWKNVFFDLNRNSCDDFNFRDLCRAYLISLGYRFDPEVKVWYQLGFEVEEPNSKNLDALTFIFLRDTQDLVLEWAFENGFIEYRVYDRWEYSWFFDKEKFNSYLKENNIRL